MATKFTVPINKIIKDFNLEILYMPETEEEILISSADVNRPGLNLTGYLEYFDQTRIQIFGLGEMGYLKQLSPEERKLQRRQHLRLQISCVNHHKRT